MWRNVYGHIRPLKATKNHIKTGDHVRISKPKGVFTKGYKQTFTDEIFVVAGANVKEGVCVYRLKDYDGEAIKGVFYLQDFQKVPKDPQRVYRIAAVLEVSGKGAKKQCLVKWVGWPDKFNSWVPAASIKDIIAQG